MSELPPNRQAPRPDLDMAQDQVLVSDGIAGWSKGDILLTLWQRPAREARVRQVNLWVDAFLEQCPDSFAACQFLLPSASPPDRRGRAEAKKGLLRHGPRARRLISVPLGGGPWQRVVRTIIRLAILIYGHGALVKVAASEAQAFALLAQVASDRSPEQRQLIAGLTNLYRALDLEPPGELLDIDNLQTS